MSGDASRGWLSNLPQTWMALPLGYRYSVQLGKMLDAKQITGKHSAPYLRNVDVQWGRVNVDDLPEMDFDSDDRVRFSLRAGDLLVCEGGEIGRAAVWQGHINECYYQKAIHRVRALSLSECSQFLYYCFHTAVSAGVFTGGTGTTTIEHLPAERLRKIRFPFPPAGDQLAIASFLDRETARIDALIGKKRRLLELLEEKRLAVITHAVTKGLDPNAPMQDSGIDWLGQIPAHWTLGRIASIQERITYGFTNPMPTEDDGPYMLTANDIDFGRIKYETARHTSQEAYETDITDKSRPQVNDLLLTKDGTLGRVALFDGQKWLHNFRRRDEWNLCLTAGTVVPANQER